ncbi:rhomboid domain-containing protein 3 [Poeciliopsis prolifica]|uniref:rhomboid domain-containing protein 3 n=1 Tax=Poeciliopsis prolifica TaxID=188132 RepID=UPI0024130E35|nr:rhomboid domain-containing protein 3 [Poeciliopsis prolifica]
MMLSRVRSVRSLFGSDRPGFCLVTFALIAFMLLMYAGGIQASLSVGPGGYFPRFIDVFLYALSHDDSPSLLISIVLLLVLGSGQERRWGSVAFLLMSILTITMLAFIYTLVLFVVGGEASRICGFSAIQLALFTAQCRQATQRRLLRYLPVWLLPWLFLLSGLLLLPGTPALLHLCAICIGHNYHQPFIGVLQDLEEANIFAFIPNWMYVPTLSRVRLPTFATSHRSLPLAMAVDFASPPPVRDPTGYNLHPWMEPPSPAWVMEEQTAAVSEAEVLEEQMLRAGIMASLQDTPDTKVEVPKSSVSSLRLQQLEKMGFPTEKAVVALAATKQLDGAISLLIEDSIGEQAVVVSKGKSHPTQQSP